MAMLHEHCGNPPQTVCLSNQARERIALAIKEWIAGDGLEELANKAEIFGEAGENFIYTLLRRGTSHVSGERNIEEFARLLSVLKLNLKEINKS